MMLQRRDIKRLAIAPGEPARCMHHAFLLSNRFILNLPNHKAFLSLQTYQVSCVSKTSWR